MATANNKNISTEATAIAAAEEKAKVAKGTRYLIWDPSKDITAKNGVGNERPIRSCHYSWMAGAAGTSIGGAIPSYKVLNLRVVGRNSVDSQLWEEAKADSSTRPDDPLGARIRSGAILEVNPKADAEAADLLSSYGVAEQMLLLDNIWDADVIRGELDSIRDAGVRQYAIDRIRQLESGELR
ncbi:MAG: hypothetical protein ACP5RH_01085 [Leptodesmis sp.]|uniref:hypothetical protein n=1 Tax=Leptodesmis sp. TaxID=3100501 RepID=UPI003D0A9CD8